MPDLSVYVTVKNQTKEHLKLLSSNADPGHWENHVPSRIGAMQTVKFQLKDDLGFYGSDGDWSFGVYDDEENMRSTLKARQACPWGTYDNVINLELPNPSALYNAYFDASVDGGEWTHNSVEANGHPVEVIYTLLYQERNFRFKVVRIAAPSAHPVRNTRNELLFGLHNLWDSATATEWADGVRGSFAPNVFAYDFVQRPPADRGAVNVTVQPVDAELTGAEVIVTGSDASSGVPLFRTDFFFLKTLFDPVTEMAHTLNVEKMPFVRDGDIAWTMQLRLSDKYVTAVQPNITRLELYWHGPTLHRAFRLHGVPVIFLRETIPRDRRGRAMDARANTSHVQADDDMSQYYALATEQTFSSYNKIYDTVSGASYFGVAFWGGNFNLTYYLMPNESGLPGTLCRHVNCYDQAAMLELCCSVFGSPVQTSWLGQAPFGFIKGTHLVGVTNGTEPINVNNPFFGTDHARAMVDLNDPHRTFFMSHVFVGHTRPFDHSQTPIYDACAGPHIGTENPFRYLSQSIDTDTTLYPSHGIAPGTTGTIQEGDGITYTDGRVPRSRSTAEANRVLTKLIGTVERKSITHRGWPQVNDWLSKVLGEHWAVDFKTLSVTGGIVHGFWHLVDKSRGQDGPPVQLAVTTSTVVTLRGALDFERSENAARDRVAELLSSSDRHPESIWTRGQFDEFGDYSLQYKPELERGRIVVVSKSTVVHIASPQPVASLSGTARALLKRVVVSGEPQLEVPLIPAYPEDPIAVDGPLRRFTATMRTNDPIATAGVTTSEDDAIILDKVEIVESAGGGKGTDICYSLIAKREGKYTLELHVAHEQTMIAATQKVKLDVAAGGGD